MSAEDAMKEVATNAIDSAESPKEKLKNTLVARGYNGLLSFGRLFRRKDDDRSGTLNIGEVTEIFHEMAVDISDEEIAEIVQEFDADGEGTINYEEFLTAMRPDMNDARLAVVEEAFAALDETGEGTITLEDLRTKCNVSEHPSVLDGSETEDEVLGRFISRLENSTATDGAVTKKEFIEYYVGVSRSFDNDDHFIEVVRKAYGLH